MCHSIDEYRDNTCVENKTALKRAKIMQTDSGVLKICIQATENLRRRTFLSVTGLDFLTGGRACVCVSGIWLVVSHDYYITRRARCSGRTGGRIDDRLQASLIHLYLYRCSAGRCSARSRPAGRRVINFSLVARGVRYRDVIRYASRNCRAYQIIYD